MKKTIIFLCMTVFTLTACNNGSSTDEKVALESDSATISNPADNTKTEETWVAVDSATEMKAWMDYATPGDVHKMLGKWDGTWTGQSTMWMAMDAPPTTNTSTMTNKMMLGGRYQMSTFKGNFMGMPFEGMSTTAYDNYKKKFISTWVDNMGTGVMKMEGTWDDATKTISYTGSSINPANGKECTMREIYKIVDDNNHIMEMYGPDSKTGKEYKTMEIKLTRNK